MHCWVGAGSGVVMAAADGCGEVGDSAVADAEMASEAVTPRCDKECVEGGWWALARAKPTAADAATSAPIMLASATGRRKRRCVHAGLCGLAGNGRRQARAKEASSVR